MSLEREGGPNSPTRFFPGELPPEADPSAFPVLPARIQKKITVDKRCGCWNWTGSVTPRRRRYKAYPTPIDYDGRRNFSGCHQDERAVPNVWHAKKKQPVSAARYIYELLAGIDYENVPILMRCPNDLCVNPYHVHCKDIPPNQKRALAQAKQFGGLSFESEIAQTEKPTGLQEDMLETLKKLRPAEWSDIDLVEDEFSLGRNSISSETWAAYVAWAMENPEEED